MAIEYCCFVSYPHGQDDVLVPFVQDFVKGLETEIYAQQRRRVWADYKFLKSGNLLDESIGSELCRSACMVLLYTPLYFDSDHTTCARELHAMLKLEEQRMATIPNANHGLIIPIILRGRKKFPLALRENRLFKEFTDIEFNDPKEKLREKYAKEIREIAEYIIDRCDQLDEALTDAPHDCDTYRLPSVEDARAFVEKVLGVRIANVAVPFVIRSDRKTIP
jgi:hypothetical protein